jgi:hypothetical protein
MKKRIRRHDRRKFLKITATGTAGMIVGGLSPKKLSALPADNAAGSAWQDGMRINPDIDNLRVVFCHDPAMVNSNPVSWTMEGQNDVVNIEQVRTNMDKLAVALAQKESPGEAWATIFQNPGKDWSAVNAAIKLNGNGNNWARLAVIEKVCLELNNLGVEYGNITIFDQHFSMLDYFSTDYVRANLPPGVQVSRHLGGTEQITLSTGESVTCAAGLANGTIDLMVNIAPNKGLDVPEVGNFTLSMKNHMGSIRYSLVQYRAPFSYHLDIPGGQDRAMETLVAMNQSDAVLGGTPPRQQLCIVDSLWGMKGGPTGVPDLALHCLVMGTLSPVVDYLTIKKIREEKPEDEGGKPYGMGVTNTVQTVVEEMLSGFGYNINSDEIQNLDFLDALAYQPPASMKRKKSAFSPGNSGSITIAVSVPGRTSRIRFPSVNLLGPPRLGIYSMQGRFIRSLTVPDGGKNKLVQWDGRYQNGKTVPAGNYIIKLRAGSKVMTRKLVWAG